jgi:hypothetical protein
MTSNNYFKWSDQDKLPPKNTRKSIVLTYVLQMHMNALKEFLETLV